MKLLSVAAAAASATKNARMRAAAGGPLRPTAVLVASVVAAAALLASTSDAFFMQAQFDALRQPLVNLVGKRADELCLKCQALECLFCYKDKL